jgi:dynactin 5
MLFNPDILISSEDYIQTSTGILISRTAVVHKPQSLEVPGGRCVIESDVIIHADIAPIQLNRYVQLGKFTVLHPSHTLSDPSRPIPLTIGANTIIGDGCQINAASIGTGCRIGNNCKISARCILKDHVRLLDNTVLLADMVIPPFAIVGGSPAQIVGEQPESTSTLAVMAATDKYKALKYRILKKEGNE